MSVILLLATLATTTATVSSSEGRPVVVGREGGDIDWQVVGGDQVREAQYQYLALPFKLRTLHSSQARTNKQKEFSFRQATGILVGSVLINIIVFPTIDLNIQASEPL